MGAVTNRYPSFIELEPIPLENDLCPILKKGFHVVCLISTATAFCGAIGFSLGLAGMGFSTALGAGGGIIAGLLMGIALSFFLHFPTSLNKYCIKTLEQMEPLQTHPRAMGSIKKLKEIFHKGFIFSQPFEVHDFYRHLALITENVPKYRPDIQKIWELFLQRLRDCKITVWEKKPCNIDPKIELERIKNPDILPHSVNISVLDKKSQTALQELKEVEQIEYLSFPKSSINSKEEILAILLKDESNKCFLAKQEKLGTLGFAWTCKQENGENYIMGIARYPNAARLNIGENLLKELIAQLPQKSKLLLHVSIKNNVALALYKQMGFETKKEEKGYYGPNQHAYLMELNWTVYEKRYQTKAA